MKTAVCNHEHCTLDVFYQNSDGLHHSAIYFDIVAVNSIVVQGVCDTNGSEGCFGETLRQISRTVNSDPDALCSTQENVISSLQSCVESFISDCPPADRDRELGRIVPEEVGYGGCAEGCDTAPLGECFDDLLRAVPSIPRPRMHTDMPQITQMLFDNQEAICSVYSTSLQGAVQCYSSRYSTIATRCQHSPTILIPHLSVEQFHNETDLMTRMCISGCDNYMDRVANILNNCLRRGGGPLTVSDDVINLNSKNFSIEGPCSVLGEIGSCLSQFTAGCQLLLDRVNLERQKLLDIEQAEDLCDLEWIHSDVTQQITSADGNGAVMIVGYSISINFLVLLNIVIILWR